MAETGITTYSDISEETGIYLNKPFLDRALPRMYLSQWAQVIHLPLNSSQQVKCRRYEPLSSEPKPLTEGVTPKASKADVVDVYFTLTQYGDYMALTDVVADTHEDPVLQQYTELLGESAGEMLEKIRIAKLMAGTNVYYANNVTSRSAVATAPTKTLIRRMTETLRVNRAQKIMRFEQSTPRFNTVNIPPAYPCLIHPYLSKSIRDIDGFKPVEDYGSVSPFEGEIGAVEGMRFIEEDLFTPWPDAGGAVDATAFHSTSGTKADVYPMLAFGANAYADVALKGYSVKNADSSGKLIVPVKIMALNPNVARGGDPIGQRGSVAYKLWWAGGWLQDLYGVRGEVAAEM